MDYDIGDLISIKKTDDAGIVIDRTRDNSSAYSFSIHARELGALRGYVYRVITTSGRIVERLTGRDLKLLQKNNT